MASGVILAIYPLSHKQGEVMRYSVAQAVCPICGKFVRGDAYTDSNDARMLLKQDHMDDTGHWIADEAVIVKTVAEAPKKAKRGRKQKGKMRKL